MEADIKAEDRGELVSVMEPLVITDASRHRGALTDLALDLTQKSAGFRRSLPPTLLASLADLVRAMNCYYSNLIEGHDTHPVDIERALKNDYSKDTRKRDLQLEAKAHIAVQKWIDGGGLKGARAITSRRNPGNSPALLRTCCPRIFSGLKTPPRRNAPAHPRRIAQARRPGRRPYRHQPRRPAPLPGALRGRSTAISARPTRSSPPPRPTTAFCGCIHSSMAMAAWRGFMSHAMLLDILDTGAVWSVARGLARSAQEYKTLLANCDLPRRNDLDGRGTLSEEALAEFTRFFLTVCIDQVSFMESLVQPDRLRARILLWAEEETRLGQLPAKSGSILEAVLYRGELPRGESAAVVGTGERQARRIVSALLDKEVLVSDSPRAPLRLAFPAALASRWVPGLFPEKAG